MPLEADAESTAQLLVRARAGDASAFERLFERHAVPLRRWARGRLPRAARDLADTDDIVQDVLVQTLRRIETFEPRRPGALHAYLRQAVFNRIRDELRRVARHVSPSALSTGHVDRGASPLDLAIGREAVERYERALEALRPEDRAAVIGRVEMQYSYDALADVLDKPSAEAARKAAERALVRLAREMGRVGP